MSENIFTLIIIGLFLIGLVFKFVKKTIKFFVILGIILLIVIKIMSGGF